jgi:hypothetical protein
MLFVVSLAPAHTSRKGVLAAADAFCLFSTLSPDAFCLFDARLLSPRFLMSAFTPQRR